MIAPPSPFPKPVATRSTLRPTRWTSPLLARVTLCSRAQGPIPLHQFRLQLLEHRAAVIPLGPGQNHRHTRYLSHGEPPVDSSWMEHSYTSFALPQASVCAPRLHSAVATPRRHGLMPLERLGPPLPRPIAWVRSPQPPDASFLSQGRSPVITVASPPSASGHATTTHLTYIPLLVPFWSSAAIAIDPVAGAILTAMRRLPPLFCSVPPL